MRLEFARLEPGHQFFEIFLMTRGFAACECTPENADNLAAFEEREIERNFRNGAGGKTNNEIAPFPIGCTQRGFGIVTTDRVINDVGTLASRQFLDLVRERLLLVAIKCARRIDKTVIGAMILGNL